MNFADSLSSGQLGESLIAQWLRRRGWHVLPAYEKEIDNGKGPRLFMASDASKAQLISPDLLVMRSGKFLWVEAKHKTRFSWYGKGGYWVTGVDRRHFEDYCAVTDNTGMGLYTAPSPNRLVFLKGGSWHQINRVDQNAGDHMRCSVVGFFTKEKVEL
jgi:hypothetical protein